LEPGQVRTEGPAIHGRGATGRGQPGGRPGRVGAARRNGIPGRDTGAMARSHRPIGSRPRVAPTYGPGGAPAHGVGVQRGGGGGALADAAGWTEVAERSGVSNAALKLTELTTGGVRWQVLPQWRHL